MGAPWFRQPTCAMCNGEILAKTKVMYIEGRTGVLLDSATSLISLYKSGNHGNYWKIICLECWNKEIAPRVP